MSRKDRAPRQSILVPAVEGHRGLSVESDFEASLSPPLRYEEDGNLLARDARETQFNSGVPDVGSVLPLGRGNTGRHLAWCRLKRRSAHNGILPSGTALALGARDLRFDSWYSDMPCE